MSSETPETQLSDASPGGSLKRRTVLAGAAWTIPVMAVATASPAMAASNDLTLAFDKSSYSGEACGTITGAKVAATRGGAPAPGTSVTVTLSNGYTFDGGSTSYTGTAGSDGSLAVPNINVPAGTTNGTATATASGAQAASAGLSGTANGGKLFFAQTNSNGEGGVLSEPGLPSEPMDEVYKISNYGLVRTTNGDVYARNGSTGQWRKVGSNARAGSLITYDDSAARRMNDGNAQRGYYIADGRVWQVNTDTDQGAFALNEGGLPTADVEEIYKVSNYGLVRTANGDVYARNSGPGTWRKVGSNALAGSLITYDDTAAQRFGTNGHRGYYIADGKLWQVNTDTDQDAFVVNESGLPTSGIAEVYKTTNYGLVRTTNGDVYARNSRTGVWRNVGSNAVAGSLIAYDDNAAQRFGSAGERGYYISDGKLWQVDTDSDRGAFVVNEGGLPTSGIEEVYKISNYGLVRTTNGDVYARNGNDGQWRKVGSNALKGTLITYDDSAAQSQNGGNAQFAYWIGSSC